VWQAAGESRGPERNELLSKAGSQLYKARELDPNEQLVHLAYGQLNIIRGDLKLAKVTTPMSNRFQMYTSMHAGR
jgi:hypothetical protein